MIIIWQSFNDPLKVAEKKKAEEQLAIVEKKF
jgi:hypothetical protein